MGSRRVGEEEEDGTGWDSQDLSKMPDAQSRNPLPVLPWATVRMIFSDLGTLAGVNQKVVEESP